MHRGVEDGLVNATDIQQRNQHVQQSSRAAALPVLTCEMMGELIISEAFLEIYSRLSSPQRVDGTNVFMEHSKALHPPPYVGHTM